MNVSECPILQTPNISMTSIATINNIKSNTKQLETTLTTIPIKTKSITLSPMTELSISNTTTMLKDRPIKINTTNDINEQLSFDRYKLIEKHGLIVQKRDVYDKRNKYLLTRFLEFLAVCHWVLCFLFSGLFCLFISIYLTYKSLKNVINLISFTVGDNLQIYEKYSLITDWSFYEENIYSILLILLIVLYFSYWFIDLGAENRGSHPKKSIRKWKLWIYLANYFPIHLVLSNELINYSKNNETDGIILKLPLSSSSTTRQTTESTRTTLKTASNSYTELSNPLTCSNEFELEFKGLSSTRNYLVGYHPHGIFVTGAFVNFMTEATGFSKIFPNLHPLLAVLKAHFLIPIYRDYLMSNGIIAATRRGLRYSLDSEQCGTSGNFVIVVLGGAPEALDARPGRYIMHVKQRFGFFKLALQTGSSLIPCISFGEQGMYNQLSNKPGSWIRCLQDKFTAFSTFALPFFYARGPLPYRTPIHTVIGAPIPCEKIEKPTREQVGAIKNIYLERLQALFNYYKPVYDPNAHDIEFV